MENCASMKLIGSDIHGFHTYGDLDIQNTLEEAKSRWLRPNEIHAMLCNHRLFHINAKPVTLPKSGTILFFDRKMLRNFRKDGHKWKKKKDGRTVKEAHEHLKVGYDERIHVYYAHGEDNPTFNRRCYWLLDKSLEHIVLVHYRETQEMLGSPTMPMNSNSSSISDQSTPKLVAEDIDSRIICNTYFPGQAASIEPGNTQPITTYEMKLHEINTLEWDELLVTNDPNNSSTPNSDNVSGLGQQQQADFNGSISNGIHLPAYDISAEIPSLGNLVEPSYQSDNVHLRLSGSVYNQTMGVQVNPNAHERYSNPAGSGESLHAPVNDGLQSQESFKKWVNYILSDSPGSVDNTSLEPSLSPSLTQDSFTSPAMGHLQSTMPEQIFSISDLSPAWAYSTEETKILVIGVFHEGYTHIGNSNLFCICGDVCVPAEIVQVGAYRCILPPQSPGTVNLYLSFDGHKPISQVLSFEYRAKVLPDDRFKWEEFQIQLRLTHLLFSTSKSLNILASKVPPAALQEAKTFAHKASNLIGSWEFLIKAIQDGRISVPQAKDSLFELTLKNRLKEWLLERIADGSKTTEFDAKGQGVIHLCAILGYTWAIHLFSYSGLSLDFRDKHGWTALHWAAYYGREKMVAALLSAGAKPNFVTDPTSQNPGGCTAADLASKNGFDGLAAYLSEKALISHFDEMKLAGNISGSLQTTTTDTTRPENLNDEELYLKDALAAYRTAAEAASRIHVAFREHALKVRTNAVRFANPEEEARGIIAAMKIQHAFRNHEVHKRMAAAARIQHRFRTWKIRREFLNMRRRVIRIQAAFRGYQERRHYRKILWSVGVLEKAVLRWRLKRKGFRGLKVEPVEAIADYSGSDTEDGFYRTSQKQAEERCERSVVRIQAMFRSKKAQQDYRRMKLTHEQATVDYGNAMNPDDTDSSKQMDYVNVMNPDDTAMEIARTSLQGWTSYRA